MNCVVTILIPHAEDRQAHHIRIAAKLQVSQEAKQIQTARKAEERRKSKGMAKKSNKQEHVSSLKVLDPDKGEKVKRTVSEMLRLLRLTEIMQTSRTEWKSDCPTYLSSLLQYKMGACIFGVSCMDYRHNEQLIFHKIPR